MVAQSSNTSRLVRIARFGFSCAMISALVFAGLWAAAQLPMGPSDLVIELVASPEQGALTGLFKGILILAAAGFVVGVVADLIYEGLRGLECR